MSPSTLCWSHRRGKKHELRKRGCWELKDRGCASSGQNRPPPPSAPAQPPAWPGTRAAPAAPAEAAAAPAAASPAPAAPLAPAAAAAPPAAPPRAAPCKDGSSAGRDAWGQVGGNHKEHGGAALSDGLGLTLTLTLTRTGAGAEGRPWLPSPRPSKCVGRGRGGSWHRHRPTHLARASSLPLWSSDALSSSSCSRSSSSRSMALVSLGCGGVGSRGGVGCCIHAGVALPHARAAFTPFSDGQGLCAREPGCMHFPRPSPLGRP